MPNGSRIVDMSAWYVDPTIDLYEFGILKADEELLLYKPSAGTPILDEDGKSIVAGDEILPKIYLAVKKQKE